MNRIVLAVLVLLGVLLYLRSPIDLIPDRVGAPGLLDDLLALLAAGFWMWRQWSTARTSGGTSHRTENGSGKATRASRDFDPYRVLGISRGASREEITRAYREQMKLYHPDRVAELGEELRSVAHEKTLEIQRAYDALTPQ